MDLNSYKYGSSAMSNVSGFLDNVNKTQLARNQANRGGNKTMVVPSFNILNPATRYEGTIMSQRTNELLLNAKRTIAFLYSPRSNKYFPILKHICAIDHGCLMIVFWY